MSKVITQITLTRTETVTIEMNDGAAIPLDTKVEALEFWANSGNLGKSMVDLVELTQPDHVKRVAEKWTLDKINGVPVERVEPGKRK
jgi:hypothetical protein